LGPTGWAFPQEGIALAIHEIHDYAPDGQPSPGALLEELLHILEEGGLSPGGNLRRPDNAFSLGATRP